MLGREVYELFRQQNRKVISSDREVDIRSLKELREFAEKHKPSWIINCSAYTAVDKAEENRSSAYELNRDGAANIARIANELDIPMVHISTDYIFDGSSPEPLTEEDNPGPLTVYGKSKLAGEEEIKKLSPRHFIIRTAWLYGKYGKNFIFTMLYLMGQKVSIKVVDDQIGSPTWTRNLAEFIIYLIYKEPSSYGTYHFSGEGQCSWFEFAKEIFREGTEKGLLTKPCRIDPCSSDAFPTKAKRPAYSLLSKKKISDLFQYRAPHWEASLELFIQGLKNERKQTNL